MRLVFDLETDNFLNSLTTIHCIGVRNLDDPDQTWSYGPGEIDKGIAQLAAADMLVAHNGLVFDICAIKKLHPDFSTEGILIRDTLVLSRLIRADLRNDDFLQAHNYPDMPKKLFGSHGLEAWGHRLGFLKGDFAKTTDWSEYSDEMMSYCLQDTLVTHRLWTELSPEKWSQKSIEFEHKIAELCNRIGTAGWTFDQHEAASLYAQLALERSTLEDDLQTLFPNWVIEDEFIPKVNNKKLGYEKNVPFIKKKTVQFNPNSRKHIEFCLRNKYGWKPKEFTPSGDAKIDERTLGRLSFPEAKKLARSFMLQKRIGMLAEGNAAWMRLVDSDGKLQHTINPNGTVTGRASSFGPNPQQVPATRAEFGAECRSLFKPSPGYVLVGADLSGLELRCLAHFLADDGAYAREVVEGDVHTANMKAAGLATRDQAKTFIYALLYGAGDSKIGSIVGKGAQEGAKLRKQFLVNFPAFKALLTAVKHAVKQRGHLIGLDLRKLPIRSEHAALNTLLQSAGALVCKKWIELVDAELTKQNLDARIIAWVHDEIQIEVNAKGDGDHVGRITRRMAEEAGRAFGFRVPIDAEYRIGGSWAGTH